MFAQDTFAHWQVTSEGHKQVRKKILWRGSNKLKHKFLQGSEIFQRRLNTYSITYYKRIILSDDEFALNNYTAT